MNNKLDNLEKKLNKAHKEYLNCKDCKGKEYQKVRDDYLQLAELYREEFRKSIRGKSKNEDI